MIQRLGMGVFLQDGELTTKECTHEEELRWRALTTRSNHEIRLSHEYLFTALVTDSVFRNRLGAEMIILEVLVFVHRNDYRRRQACRH